MITINGRFLVSPVTGVQRYARELCAALDRLLQSDAAAEEVTCLVPPDYAGQEGWSRIAVRRVGRRRGNLWEQIDLPRAARGRLLFSPANIGPYFHDQQVVTIHDASVFTFPRAYSFTFRMKYRLIYRRMARIAQKIITVSEFSKHELMRTCGMREAQFAVIPEGSEQFACTPADETILQKAGLEGKAYFLGVGSQSPHKNMQGLISAFRTLDRPEVELVLVGGAFGRVFQTAELALPARARHLGYVSDGALRALYQHALGFVFPSFYEGFGLPVLEAMTSQCPVVCSTAASLPEVGGDAVLYCDPADPADIARQMRALLDDPALRQSLASRGALRAQGFTWDAAARQTWEILNSQFIRAARE